MLEITKEEVIEKHYDMWEWIARRYDDHVSIPCSDLKNVFASVKNISISRDSRYIDYCCVYDIQKKKELEAENRGLVIPYCVNCPLKWGTEGKYEVQDNNRYYYCLRHKNDKQKHDDFVLMSDMNLRYNKEKGRFEEIPMEYFIYGVLLDEEYEQLAKQARRIANLPEK